MNKAVVTRVLRQTLANVDLVVGAAALLLDPGAKDPGMTDLSTTALKHSKELFKDIPSSYDLGNRGRRR